MLAEQLANGLAQGGTYALLAVGMALIIGTIRLVTFAHGEVFMAGAYAAFMVMGLFQGSPLVGFAAAIAVSALLGVVIEFVGFRLLRNAPHTSSLLVTIGFSIVLINTAQLIWGAETRSFPVEIATATIKVFDMEVSAIQAMVYILTLVVIAGVHWVLKYTKLGRVVRATALDHEAAFVLGVNINRIYSLTFAFGSALGGLAGVLVGLYYNAVYPTMGVMMGLKAFSACILGGLGSIPGAVIAALFLGEAENLTVAYIGSGYRHVLSFAILIVVLLFWPQGLFGKKEQVR
jgi:branched-chain amino acid transport system permease protein